MDLKKKKKSPFREQSSQKADWNETVELTLPWVFPEPRLQTERPEKVSVCSVSAVAHRCMQKPERGMAEGDADI